MDKEYEIVEKSFLVPCKRDPAGMERRCYVRLLITEKQLTHNATDAMIYREANPVSPAWGKSGLSR